MHLSKVDIHLVLLEVQKLISFQIVDSPTSEDRHSPQILLYLHSLRVSSCLDLLWSSNQCLTPVMVLIAFLHHFSTTSGGTQDLYWCHILICSFTSESLIQISEHQPTPVTVLIAILHHFSTISGGTQDLNWFHFGQKSHEAYLSKILSNLHSFTVWH